MTARSILHVDMDAFYASVEQRDRPELAGRPVIVGHAGPRGVVAAASYAVRRFGVHSAMPIGTALRLCPHAIIVPPRIARYREVSAMLLAIFRELTPLVEPLSLDEAFLDVSASLRLLGDARAIGERIRRRIRAQTGLTASVGIAPNKLVAKIASDINKPDGLCEISAAQLPAALDALPIQRLWGIGPKTLPAVQAAGIHCFADLRVASEPLLRQLFGRHAATMRRRAAGIDDREVSAEHDEQSISAERTFEADLRDPGELQTQLSMLVERVATRLRGTASSAALLGIKVRLANFTTHSRQRSFTPPVRDTAALWASASELLDTWFGEHPRAAVRLLGVSVSGLRSSAQADLFDHGPVKAARVDAAVDEVRRRFGEGLLMRASHIRRTPG
jgi:DNA polymerase-4